jgi:2,5-diamino-6-(ribosylamino)-4(3H)-pyrimidinone 5'-phosphate reductase
MERPYVYLNVAMTADGKVDTFERRGAAISSKRDKDRVDRLRAEADAVMVGGRTLLNENPKLTVKSADLRAAREARGLTPNPVKVGVVSVADLKPDSDFLTAGPARIVIFTTQGTSEEQLEFLRARGVDLFVHDTGRVDLPKALGTLKDLGINHLMVEGGGTLNFELLRLGLVDELTAYVAPLVFGGESAPTLAAGPGLVHGAAIPLKLVDAEAWEDGGVLLQYKLFPKGG